jgi:hypothetical protein
MHLNFKPIAVYEKSSRPTVKGLKMHFIRINKQTLFVYCVLIVHLLHTTHCEFDNR